jgi:4-amino-4-deoxychorismate lyase
VESALRDGAGEPGLTLIETLGWDGTTFPRLSLHLARLRRSAARLGWECDPEKVEVALRAVAPSGRARMRLTLDKAGAVQVQASPLPPSNPQWTVTWAPQRLASDDPWLTVKSSRRAVYDSARAALPAGADEAIFLNERGEVCDGTITTVFFDRGQGMRTPPLACGLLPGVLRAELGLPEEILLAAEVPNARLWVGNSLRGLIPCSFTSS